jgi:hypothetical protein
LLAVRFVLVASLAGCTVKDQPRVVVTPQILRSELYIAPEGLDSNPGTRIAPLRTLARAAVLVQPGTTVNVLPGIYPGGFRTSINGQANARIVFRSTQRWRAHIVPPFDSTSTIAWDNRASYVDIQGFDVDGDKQVRGVSWRTGIRSRGAFNRILSNQIQHIATTAPCTEEGAYGIDVDSDDDLLHSDIIGNTMHDIGGPHCPDMEGIGIGMPATVANNVVYRIAGAAIEVAHESGRVIVSNNTITTSGTGILVTRRDTVHTHGRYGLTQVFNNIVFDNSDGIAQQARANRNNSYRHNLVFGNKKSNWRLATGIKHSGTISAAPAFLSYTRSGTPNFGLRAGSPAIGSGLHSGTGDVDFCGKLGTREEVTDLGACQH